MKRLGLWLALTCLLLVPALAETHPPPWVTVIRPGDGKLVGVAQLDRLLLDSLKDGSGKLPEMPHARAVVEEPAVASRMQSPLPDLQNSPAEFRGKPVLSALAFDDLGSGKLLVFLEHAQQEYAMSGSVVVLGKEGRVEFGLPGLFKLSYAGATAFVGPPVRTAGPYALVQEEGKIAGYDVLHGVRLWSVPGRLGFPSGRTRPTRTGLWLLGTSLYVSTEDGLWRLDSRSGRVRWKCPLVGERVTQVESRPDGNLYVVSTGFPAELLGSLERAARKRRAGDVVASAMIPYRNGATYFARVSARGQKASVWEYVDGKWSWIFDYPPDMPEAKKDQLFAKHKFSAWMRKRLEIGW